MASLKHHFLNFTNQLLSYLQGGVKLMYQKVQNFGVDIHNYSEAIKK